jgi:hypothetical protein
LLRRRRLLLQLLEPLLLLLLLLLLLALSLLLQLALLGRLELCLFCVRHMQSQHVRLFPPWQPDTQQQDSSSSIGM